MIENFLFLLTGIIGLVVIFLMIISYKSNPVFNIFLMLIFIMSSTRFLIHGSFELGLQTLITPDKGPSSILYLAIIPSLYLYYRKLINEERHLYIKELKHYLFIVLFYLVVTVPVLKNSFLFYYGPITYFIIIALFFGFYLWISFNLLRNKLWNKTDLQMGSTHYNLIKNWTVYLIILNALIVITILISIYSEATTGLNLSGKSMAPVLLLLWLFVYLKILISPEILFGLPVLNKKLLLLNKTIARVDDSWELSFTIPKNNQDVRLQVNIKSNILSYANNVDKLSHTAHVFRNSTYSYTDLANEMRVPTSHIIYLFKYHSKISFSEYKTQSRIQDAINLIHNDYLNTNTIESLAYKTGFSSYNPFFSAFKKVKNISPQEYIKIQKNV